MESVLGALVGTRIHLQWSVLATAQNFDLDVHESEHTVTQSTGFDPEAPPFRASHAVMFLLAHACHWAWF